LPIFRQNDSGVLGARRARRSRYSAQMASSARFLVEELESRVLLNGAPDQRSLPFFTSDLHLRAVAVSTWAQPPFDVAGGSTAKQAWDSGASPAVTDRLVLVHVHLPTQSDPPSLVFASPRMSEGEQGSNSAIDTQSAAPGDGGLASPFFVSAGTDSSNDTGDPSTPAAGPATGPSASVQSSGMGWVNFESVPTYGSLPFAGLPGSANWQNIADAKHVDVAGTLDADQTSVTFAIPVGALTESLGLSLRETAGDDPPMVGQMDLVNPAGVTVDQFGPMSGPGPTGLQNFTIQLHNATNGSRLVVQVTTAEPLSPASPSPESGTTAAQNQASNDNVTFVLDVQRQEALSPVESTGISVPDPISVGTLVVAPTLQGGASVSSSTWTAPDEQQDGESAPATQGATTAVASAAPESPDSFGQSLESFNVRVSTGPLASRSASPLGPTLASIDAEATQQVDRHERAVSQEIEGLEPIDGEHSTVRRSDDTDSELSSRPGSSRFAGPGGPVVEVLGSGGFPMMVTSPGRGHHVPLADLWAALPSFSDWERSPSSSAHVDITLGEVPETSAATSRLSSDSAALPDYMKAAFGLAFGLVMTSGPLLPDLLGSLPRRIPKWLAALRARTGRAGSSSSTT
jgi:hypothetical protein